jgi:tRNA modification GTPase
MALSESHEDTIAAVATPPGRGAVSLVRLSGPRAREIAAAGLHWTPERFLPRRAQLGLFHGNSGEPLDRVLATFFPEPNSYTGQDVLELSCHGSPVVVVGVLEACVALGARLARPGEFTLRAFLGGKIDLIQAEAVRDLVESQTTYQAEVARRQLEGSLSAALRPLKETLVDVVSHLETTVEFVEDDVEPEERYRLDERLGEVEAALEEWVRSYRVGRVVHDGVTVVLAGRPNAGKSSIFNHLVNEERAIVTPLPGTTRDALREVLDVRGIPVRLIDTAGIRVGGDLVERKGVERSIRESREADLVLLVQDGESGAEEGDRRAWREVTGRPYVVVQNKSDLRRDWRVAEEIGAGSLGCVRVSALTGEGMEELADLVASVVVPGGGPGRDRAMVTSLRQKACLEAALKRLRKARGALVEGLSEEFASYEVVRCLEAMGELTGETTPEDILNRIFSSFCIGK